MSPPSRVRRALQFVSPPAVIVTSLGLWLVVVAIDVVVAAVFLLAGGNEPATYGLWRLWLEQVTPLSLCTAVVGTLVTGLLPLLLIVVRPDAGAARPAGIVRGTSLAAVVVAKVAVAIDVLSTLQRTGLCSRACSETTAIRANSAAGATGVCGNDMVRYRVTAIRHCCTDTDRQ